MVISKMLLTFAIVPVINLYAFNHVSFAFDPNDGSIVGHILSQNQEDRDR